MRDIESIAEALGVTLRERDFGQGAINVDKMLSEGWTYRDIPWLDQRLWNGFLECFGEGEYKILAMSSRGKDCRGQILLSEQGRINLNERRDILERLSAEVFGKEGKDD